MKRKISLRKSKKPHFENKFTKGVSKPKKTYRKFLNHSEYKTNLAGI